MHVKILILTTLVQLATSVKVIGYLGEACHGERLWEYVVPTRRNCQDVNQFELASSILVAKFNPGQGVALYTEANCHGNPMSRWSGKACDTVPNNNVKSFRVMQVRPQFRRNSDGIPGNHTELVEYDDIDEDDEDGDGL